MTVTLEVSLEEAARLQAAAAERGQEVSDYLLTLARQEFQEKPPASAPFKYEGMNLAEVLAGRIGLCASADPSNMAENSEEEFGKIMDEKNRQGHV
jgi:hypothetical protein